MLQGPDLSLNVLSKALIDPENDVAEALVQRWKATLVDFMEKEVCGIMDLVRKLDYLVQMDHTYPFHRSSILGKDLFPSFKKKILYCENKIFWLLLAMYIRRLVLYADHISFSDMANLKTTFSEFILAAKAVSTSLNASAFDSIKVGL